MTLPSDDPLAVEAELRKLSALLDIDYARFKRFEKLPAADLRSLREAMSAILFDENRPAFRRLEAASRIVPNALVAKIAVKAFGAMIAGRVAGEMPPKRAIDLGLRLPEAFLADVCVHLDPRQAPELVTGMPVPTIRKIAATLLARRDYITMGRFVDVLTDAALDAVIADITDDSALLHIGFYVEDRSHLDGVLSRLDETRLRGLITAAYEQDLWPEVLALMRHVGTENRTRLADLTAAQDEALLADLVEVTQRRKLWPEVIALIDDVSEHRRVRLVNLAPLQRKKVLKGIVEAAREHELWAMVLPLAAQMTVDHQRAMVEVLLGAPREVFDSLLEACREQQLWPTVLSLVSLLDHDDQGRLAQQVLDGEPEVIGSLLESAQDTDLWPELLPLLEALEPGHQQQVVAQALEMGLPMIEICIKTAQNYERWPVVLRLLAELEPAEQRRVAASGKLSAKLRKSLSAQIEQAGLTAPLAPLSEALN